MTGLLRRTMARLILTFGAMHAMGAAAWASPGCDQVNAGAWNASLPSFAIGATLTGFDNCKRA